MIAAFLLAIATTLAQAVPEVADLNAQLFRPSIDARMTIATDDAGMAHHLAYGGRAAFHWVDDPFVLTSADGQEIELLSSAAQLDLMGGVTLHGARLGVYLPVYVHTAGDLGDGGAGLGDLGLDGKYTFLDGRTAPLGLAAALRIGLPTSTPDLALGSPGLSGELAVVADKRIDALLLAANLGTRLLPKSELSNVTVNDQLFLRLGGGYAITDAAGASLDLSASFTYAEGLVSGQATPFEALLGGWYRFQELWMIRGGVGKGFTDGIGSPDWRAVLMVSLEARETPKDSDLDGIADKDDRCPTKPEDLDGWADLDGCPDATPTVFITFVEGNEIPVFGVVAAAVDGGDLLSGAAEYSMELQPGAHRLTASSAGYRTQESTIDVPDERKVMLRVVLEPLKGQLILEATDPQGRPITAHWELGDEEITGPKAVRTLRQGGYEAHVTADGYRPQSLQAVVTGDETTELVAVLQPALVEVTKERIEIAGEIFFETAKATIKPESFALLGEVAQAMIDHAEILKIRIEGHTDSRGKARYNQQLSESRAASVRDWLVDNGIEPERLVSSGYGESKPLDPREDEEAWAMNRRVDFFIEERAEE